MKSIFLILITLLNLPLKAQTLDNSVVHNKILQQIVEVASQGHTPVLLFDIDDTLVHTRERSQRIFREFAQQESIQSQYPDIAQKLLSVKMVEIKYKLNETFRDLGIANANVLKLANAFWLARFFTNEYAALDAPISGAAQFLNKVVKAGAKIVYLTGRDAPNMEMGTRSNLKRNFFPHSSENSILLMKPDIKMDDLIFKKDSFSKVAQMGRVIGVFENEPANLNAMMEAFPEAIGVFVETIHSPKPDVPNANAIWIKEYSQAPQAVNSCRAVFNN